MPPNLTILDIRKHRYDDPDLIWVSKDGRHYRLDQMETSHIRYSLALIRRVIANQPHRNFRRRFIKPMIAELLRREKAPFTPTKKRAKTARKVKLIEVGGHTMTSMKEYHNSLSFLRATYSDRSQRGGYMPIALRAFHADKGYARNYAQLEPETAAAALVEFLLRGSNDSASDQEGAKVLVSQALTEFPGIEFPFQDYRGTPQQNIIADRALTALNNNDRFVGETAQAEFVPPEIVYNSKLRNTPIAIIGQGAAGILVAKALEKIGFSNISTFEKAKEAGIWAKPNVYGGTKNNPRALTFGEDVLERARGDGTKDGHSVKGFLEAINNGDDPTRKAEIVNVFPHHTNFKHEIIDSKQVSHVFPIVINCIGTGKPRELHDPSHMKLLAGSDTPNAVRWQSVSDPRDLDGKQFCLIGLGNSTAEMMNQFYEAMDDRGLEVDFRILTHFPKDAIFNPSETVQNLRGIYRVFRDLSRPDLTGFQGDLERTRVNYLRALAEGRIIPDVTEWGQRGRHVGYNTVRGSDDRDMQADKVFALIGYRHSISDLQDMGIPVTGDGHPRADVDGEFRSSDGIVKGYFGFGAVMDAPHNKNSVVIPGMMFRLPDLLYGVIMRAAQFQIREGAFN